MNASSRWEWLDFDEAESTQIREFLSRDADGEGVDSLRIGASVRDRIAERLFPGTSTQYTRLRYVLLVPAILRKKGATIDNLPQSQSDLNSALDKANRNEKGVIGRRTRTREFVHLYWTAVRTWKLLEPVGGDVRDVTVANGLAAMQLKTVKDDDGNALSEQRVQWNPTVVRLVDQFWADRKSADWPRIHCTQDEVNFILGQWQELPNAPLLSAIADQLKKGRRQSNASYPWNVAVASKSAREDVNRAKAVSLICWSAQLAYNFALLKKARKLEAQGVETTWKLRNQDLGKTEARICELFEQWKAALEAEKLTLAPWTDPNYWSSNSLGSDTSRSFLAATSRMLVAGGKADLKSGRWSSWVEEREKVNPAPKLSNQHHLATWSGTPEMAQRWDFRWRASVRRLLQDSEKPRG